MSMSMSKLNSILWFLDDAIMRSFSVLSKVNLCSSQAEFARLALKSKSESEFHKHLCKTIKIFTTTDSVLLLLIGWLSWDRQSASSLPILRHLQDTPDENICIGSIVQMSMSMSKLNNILWFLDDAIMRSFSVPSQVNPADKLDLLDWL